MVKREAFNPQTSEQERPPPNQTPHERQMPTPSISRSLTCWSVFVLHRNHGVSPRPCFKPPQCKLEQTSGHCHKSNALHLVVLENTENPDAEDTKPDYKNIHCFANPWPWTLNPKPYSSSIGRESKHNTSPLRTSNPKEDARPLAWKASCLEELGLGLVVLNFGTFSGSLRRSYFQKISFWLHHDKLSWARSSAVL